MDVVLKPIFSNLNLMSDDKNLVNMRNCILEYNSVFSQLSK